MLRLKLKLAQQHEKALGPHVQHMRVDMPRESRQDVLARRQEHAENSSEENRHAEQEPDDLACRAEQ